MNFAIASLLALLACIGAVSSKDYFRGCFYDASSQNRPDSMWKFTPENYEPGLCTHGFFAFVSMGDDFKMKPIGTNDIDLYARANALKMNQTDFKTILSFGGYDIVKGTGSFSRESTPLMLKMLESVENRKIFIDSVIEYVRLHNFDGFDFNWSPAADTKDNFTLLAKEMRDSFEKEAVLVNKPRLLLFATVPARIEQIDAGYDGKVLAEAVDYLNVVAYDYHGAWENKTGFNTPVYDRNGDGLSINTTFTHWIRVHQVPREKLIMGFAAFGRGWTIPGDSVPNQVPSLALGPSPAQPFTLTEGVAAYFEICSLIEKDGYVVEFDPEQRVVFAYKNGVWIGFDNVKSHDEELKYLIDNELAGVFVWAIDMDDFRGHCASSNGTYPLIKNIRKRLTE